MDKKNNLCLPANWQAPPNINALITYRKNGVSAFPFNSNNFGDHVGDLSSAVMHNRQQAILDYDFQQEPIYLNQIHSTEVVIVEKDFNRTADAMITQIPNLPLAILTADCLPILLCAKKGNEIAAIHAGWRGLADGIITNTIQNMKTPAEHLMAWIGPAICKECFEVGSEVLDYFEKKILGSRRFFLMKQASWYANLSGIAAAILESLSVDSIFQSNACTVEMDELFYSYRRDGQTGRMATFIWINE